MHKRSTILLLLLCCSLLIVLVPVLCQQEASDSKLSNPFSPIIKELIREITKIVTDAAYIITSAVKDDIKQAMSEFVREPGQLEYITSQVLQQVSQPTNANTIQTIINNIDMKQLIQRILSDLLLPESTEKVQHALREQFDIAEIIGQVINATITKLSRGHVHRQFMNLSHELVSSAVLNEWTIAVGVIVLSSLVLTPLLLCGLLVGECCLVWKVRKGRGKGETSSDVGYDERNGLLSTYRNTVQ